MVKAGGSGLTWAGALLIAAAVTVSYFPSLEGELILDDRLNLIENRLIRAPDGPYRFWLTTEPMDYWPVFNTTLWLEWRLWGTNPVGYRVTNLILHVLTALLIWRIVAKLSIPGGFLAAMLFAVHPVNVESVAWITQLKNLLALFFSLASVVFYLNAEGHAAPGRSRTSLWYVGSIFLFALAVLSKGSAAIVPLLLALVLCWLRPLERTDLVRLFPFFALSAGLVPVNVWFQSRLDTQMPATGLLEQMLTAPAVVWFYLWKALVPIDLAFVYPRWQVSASRLAWWLPLLAAAAASVVLWRQRRGWGRPLLFTWGYFWAALLPVLGFAAIPFMEHSLVADHYQHIALIGITVLAGAAWFSWREHTQGALRRAANGVAVVTVAGLGLLTWQQSGLYASEETLYRDTLAKNPRSWMTLNNLGVLLSDTGRHAEAIDHLEQALRLKPDYADAHNNLGNALRRSGRFEEAIESYERAAELRRAYPTAHYNLGIALAEAGRIPDAIGRYREALRLQPDHVQARLNLGNLLADQGRLEEAIEEYENVLRLDPDFAEAYHNLGTALSQVGRTAEAIARYEEALSRKSDSPQTHYYLGVALVPDQPQKAIAHLREAIRLQPGYALAHNDLGVALVETGQLREAITHFEEAMRLDPSLSDALYNLQVARSMSSQASPSSQAGADDSR